jgi:hypothetical protein
LKDVGHLALGKDSPEKRSVVKLSYASATAMLRYVEEIKMMGNLRDQQQWKRRNGADRGPSFPEVHTNVFTIGIKQS